MDSFRSRFLRMSQRPPPRLLALAGRSLLRDEAAAVATLEEMPVELFPPLCMAALGGKRSHALRALVQAWPFPCLPLGALMKDQAPCQETLQAALEGLEGLLAQKVRPRRWKLKVLDLRENTHRNFWTLWSGASVLSPAELEAAQPLPKRLKVHDSRTGAQQPSACLQVLIDLCLREATLGGFLTHLIEWVKQREGSVHLCCGKLKVYATPIQALKPILNMVQLPCIQEVDVHSTWKLSVLGEFAPHLGQMVNLHRLRLSHISEPSRSSPAKEEGCVAQVTCQFLRLPHLRELYLDSVFFLKGRLDQLLRCLATHLETLSISHCPLLEPDLTHLYLCPNTGHLKGLDLSGVTLARVSPEPLKVLLEKVSATLQSLDLDDCGLVDSQLSSILPALGRCAQLQTFSFCGNPVSTSVLEKLLQHTAGLRQLRLRLCPAPLDCYSSGAVHLGRLALLHASLKGMLLELGRSGSVWFSGRRCPQCSCRTFYNPNPIRCPCHMHMSR